MLAWPHSGFHVRDGVCAPAGEREFAARLARYCARNPVALSRLEYQPGDGTVTYHSDKPTGPTADRETWTWPSCCAVSSRWTRSHAHAVANRCALWRSSPSPAQWG
ncbi:MAG: transposase [Gemmatimonadetes bacterium]|nr:transposase [Gemmatimonadota bacterium]